MLVDKHVVRGAQYPMERSALLGGLRCIVKAPRRHDGTVEAPQRRWREPPALRRSTADRAFLSVAQRRQAEPRARRPVVSARIPMNTQAKAIHSHTSFPVPAMTVGIETLRVGAPFATMIARGR